MFRSAAGADAGGARPPLLLTAGGPGGDGRDRPRAPLVGNGRSGTVR